VQREEAAAAARLRPRPGSAAGTMLACLTRGNLLDVLQEGFNEVTVPSLTLPGAPPPNGVLFGPHPLGGPRSKSPAPPQGPKGVGARCKPVNLQKSKGPPAPGYAER
jgi:hypothetical protein